MIVQRMFGGSQKPFAYYSYIKERYPEGGQKTGDKMNLTDSIRKKSACNDLLHGAERA
jgi:hypothetical protein